MRTINRGYPVNADTRGTVRHGAHPDVVRTLVKEVRRLGPCLDDGGRRRPRRQLRATAAFVCAYRLVVSQSNTRDLSYPSGSPRIIGQRRNIARRILPLLATLDAALASAPNTLLALSVLEPVEPIPAPA